MPSNIYSDNATNFVGANNELKNLFESSQFKNIVLNHCGNLHLKWHFIPARSPHMAGLQEAAVKSTKFHLKRVIGNTILKYEEMHTLLACIEACLNSRPLRRPKRTFRTDPRSFLIRAPLTAIPEHDVSDTATNRLTRWQLITQIYQSFWNRWRHEYLGQLQQRQKWFKSRDQSLAVGDIVILKETSPPLTWKLGRVTELHPGDDGVARVATVRTSNGLTRRAVRKLCILPVTV